MVEASSVYIGLKRAAGVRILARNLGDRMSTSGKAMGPSPCPPHIDLSTESKSAFDAAFEFALFSASARSRLPAVRDVMARYSGSGMGARRNRGNAG